MKINQIIVETSTTAGSVATVASPMMTQARENVNVPGLKPVKQVMNRKAKKKGPYANSIIESKKRVQEAELSEDDIILVPGQGRTRKTGFVKHDPDRAEHEGETLKNSLHTIVRVASQLDKELSTRDNFPEWVSEKIGSVKSMMVSVADYLASSKEMQHDPDAMEGLGAGVIAGGPQYESDELQGRIGVNIVNKKPRPKQTNLKNIPVGNLPKTQRPFSDKERTEQPARLKAAIKKSLGKHTQPNLPEGAKVDRMVKHVAQSEKKLGHSKKEAENIAWATANKRGMLDNKNKKK